MSALADSQSWEWTIWDILKRSSPVVIGLNDAEILVRYKDVWLRRRRGQVHRVADVYGLPVLLLAGVAWLEVGGDPATIESLESDGGDAALDGEPFLGELTVTKAGSDEAEASDHAWDKLPPAQQQQIIDAVEKDPCNVGVIGRQLRRLVELDFPGASVGDARIVEIAGTRYVRGPSLSRAAIETDTRHGTFILARSKRFATLLADG